MAPGEPNTPWLRLLAFLAIAPIALLHIQQLRAQSAPPAAEVLAGRVLEDSSGEPVASAELKIHKPGNRELVADLDTDRAGHFSGTGLPPGDYTIDAVKPNFITTTFPLHLPANTPVQLRLVRYGVMDGHVANVRGEPVPGRVMAPYGQTIGATRITVLTKQPGSNEFRSLRDASPEDGGHFRFFDLPPGQYELAMWYYGLNEGSGMQFYPDNTNPKVFTIAGGETYNNLNFLVTPTTQYKVRGKVAWPDSIPAASGFALALGLPDQPVLPIAIALAGKDGDFEFPNVPPGTYDLFTTGPTGGYTGYESVLGKGDPYYGKMRLQIGGADITGLSVPVSPARSLSVVLRAHGNTPFPAACPQSATVALTSLDPWGIAFFSANGPVSVAKEQSILNLPPGRFRVTANGLGSGCYQANDPVVDLANKDLPQPVAVEVAAAGSIRGTLHAPRPIDFAVTLLNPSNPEGTQSQLAFPSADGHFTFDALPPGKYRIAAQPATAASKTRWLTDLSKMTEITVAGGEAATVELAAGGPE